MRLWLLTCMLMITWLGPAPADEAPTLVALSHDGWLLSVPADQWQPSAEPAAIPGKRWQRSDPTATLVLARRAVALSAQTSTAQQRREAIELAMEAMIIEVLGQPAVVLSARRDMLIEEMPAALLEWQLNAAEQQWAQMALVVADQERPGAVVAIISYDWQQRDVNRAKAEALLLSLATIKE